MISGNLRLDDAMSVDPVKKFRPVMLIFGGCSGLVPSCSVAVFIFVLLDFACG